jgi:hypothetical protein
MASTTFQRVFTCLHLINCLDSMTFLHGEGFAENCNSGQSAATREKLNLGLFGWDSSPELKTKKFNNAPSFLSVTYIALSDQRFRRYRILRNNNTAGTELDSTTVGRTKFCRLDKSETSGLPNTNPIGNSLSLPLIRYPTPNG